MPLHSNRKVKKTVHSGFRFTAPILLLVPCCQHLANCFTFSFIKQSQISTSKIETSGLRLETNNFSVDCSKEDKNKFANATTDLKTSKGKIEGLLTHNSDMTNDGSSKIPVTPCVRICRYNSDFFDGAVCIGCFREAFEIQTWQSSNTQERIFTLEDAIDRQQETGNSFTGSISRDELLWQLEYYKQKQSKTQDDDSGDCN